MAASPAGIESVEAPSGAAVVVDEGSSAELVSSSSLHADGSQQERARAQK